MRCFYLSLLTFLIGVTLTAKGQDYVKYVDPLIGSDAHGHVFVGVSRPFGAIQLGPSNIYKGWDWCSGYNYSDSLIIGFSHTHLSGTGIGDLSDILMMPFTGEIKTDKGTQENHRQGYTSIFSHEDEIARPGYYSVKLRDHQIKVELAATERVGFHQYTFPKGKPGHVIIDLKEGINDSSTDTYIALVDEYTIKGYRFSSGWAKKQQVYFAIKSSVPITRFSVYDDSEHLSGNNAQGSAIKGLISFEDNIQQAQFKVGISGVSSDNALANIQAEVPHWNLKQIVHETNKAWNRELEKIRIETKSTADKRIFYTSLYHSMIHPSLFNDHNKDYRGTDGQVYTKQSFDNYSIFSTWDTYRAAHPLYLLLNPDRVNDFMNSMLAIYDQQGHLPIWHLMGNDTGTMVGISSLQIIAEAYLKGYKGFDAERAFNAIKSTALSDQRGLNYVRDFKAIPSDAGIRRSVGHALEFAVSDGSIALMAKEMGQLEDYEYFSKRAQNYKLYYDGSFLRGVMTDGSFNPIFDPLRSTKPYGDDYAEGNAWQYLWLAPQDIPGLVALIGGKEEFEKRLDEFFTIAPIGDLEDLTGNIGQYAHGNEPSHHISYLYNYIGKQWKTAEKVRYIMDNFYSDKPDGIIGNEDCGQMSAWYIFSALGFYPVFPASSEYAIGSPKYDNAILDLAGKKLEIKAINNSSANIYVQSVEIDGAPYSKTTISHDMLYKANEIKFIMGDKPNYNFGTSD